MHEAQARVIRERQRFNVLVAGRRFGKTRLGERLVAEMVAVKGKHAAWLSPTYKMLGEVWRELLDLLAPVLVSHNASENRLEVYGGGVLDMWSLENPDSIRGRHYARMIVDEAALAKNTLKETWNLILRPTLIDDQGDAFFLTTPKGRGDLMEFFDYGQDAELQEWMSWRFSTRANPYLSAGELESMRVSMPSRAIEQEIEALFIDEVLGALWTYDMLDAGRVKSAPQLSRIVVAIDPAVSANRDSDETGIVAVGTDGTDGYVLADASGTYSPDTWARKAVALYHSLGADRIVAEANQGGDMVKFTLKTGDPSVPVKLVHATRGKAVRAEPIVALYEQRRIHHVGQLPDLETQACTWSPVDDKESPDRVDALVWGLSELMLKANVWTHEQMESWARGDDLHGPQWGDPEEAAPLAAKVAEPAEAEETLEERHRREVAAMQAESMRALATRGW